MSDPIVEQVHKARAEILSDFGGDVRRYVNALKRRQQGKRIKNKAALVHKLVRARTTDGSVRKQAKR